MILLTKAVKIYFMAVSGDIINDTISIMIDDGEGEELCNDFYFFKT